MAWRIEVRPHVVRRHDVLRIDAVLDLALDVLDLERRVVRPEEGSWLSGWERSWIFMTGPARGEGSADAMPSKGSCRQVASSSLPSFVLSSRRRGTLPAIIGVALHSSPVVLRTEGLTKSFLGFVAVQDVSFTLQRGHIHAVIGPNGAGKTTFFNLLTKFLSPTSGQIFYKGEDITGSSPREIARLGVVRSFQISAIFPHLTVIENVRIALQRKLGTTFHFWRSEEALRRSGRRARASCSTQVGLAAFAHHHAVELPYGRKRALEIATTHRARSRADPARRAHPGHGARGHRPGEGADQAGRRRAARS